jgi:hypothetical protein
VAISIDQTIHDERRASPVPARMVPGYVDEHPSRLYPENDYFSIFSNSRSGLHSPAKPKRHHADNPDKEPTQILPRAASAAEAISRSNITVSLKTSPRLALLSHTPLGLANVSARTIIRLACTPFLLVMTPSASLRVPLTSEKT